MKAYMLATGRRSEQDAAGEQVRNGQTGQKHRNRETGSRFRFRCRWLESKGKRNRYNQAENEWKWTADRWGNWGAGENVGAKGQVMEEAGNGLLQREWLDPQWQESWSGGCSADNTNARSWLALWQILRYCRRFFCPFNEAAFQSM